MQVVLLLNVGVTLALVGLIWFVQIVHYPLFALVGASAFTRYEAAHVRRTSLVVVPLMLSESLTGIAIAVRPPTDVPPAMAIAAAALIGVIWLSTFALQVPRHRTLERGFERRAHAQLVRTNALRTAAWTARGALVLAMVALAS